MAVFLLGNPKGKASFDANENYELQSLETKELQSSETIGSDASEEQTPEQVITFGNNEVVEGVTEHELIAQDIPDDSSDDEWDSYGFIDIESGQYELSDITCEIKDGEGWFKYVISWDPSGNYIRVGLINEDKSNVYYVTCVGGCFSNFLYIPKGGFIFVKYLLSF